MRISDWSSDLCSSDLELLSNKTLPDTVAMPAASTLTSVRMQSPQILYPSSELILTTIFRNNIQRLGILVVTLYPKQRKLVQQKIARESCRERVCQYV